MDELGFAESTINGKLTMRKRTMTYILCFLLLLSCGNVDRNKLLGNDYRLFQGTPAQELAEAVEDEDTENIRRIVQEQKVPVDYQETRFGQTLLMLAVQNEDYKSCKALLELGADPNKHDAYNGTSAMIYAADIEQYSDDNTDFLRLLLAYGGNPNDEEIGERREGNSIRQTPLMAACSGVYRVSPIEKVKVLVEAGADVNYINEYNVFPLREALIFDHYDVVLYLLRKGADYNRLIVDRAAYSKDGKKIYILDFLREELFPVDSKQYQQKMQVVDFLRDRGLDYRKVPIPDFIVKEAQKQYPETWQEYLEKY